MTPKTPNPLALGLAIAGFLTCAAIAYAGLNAIARPGRFSERLANRAATLERIGAATAGNTPTHRFAKDVVCNRPSATASPEIQSRLARLAEKRNLSVENLTVAPGAATEALAQFSPLDVAFTANGAQADLLTFISDLETASPTVFLQRLEIRPKAGRFELRLSGRAYCSISVHR